MLHKSTHTHTHTKPISHDCDPHFTAPYSTFNLPPPPPPPPPPLGHLLGCPFSSCLTQPVQHLENPPSNQWKIISCFLRWLVLHNRSSEAQLILSRINGLPPDDTTVLKELKVLESTTAKLSHNYCKSLAQQLRFTAKWKYLKR